MSNMKNLITITLAIVSAVCLFGCSSGDYDQVAYYKGNNNDRVFVYKTSETNVQKLEKHASGQMNTEGQYTVVLYYTATPANVDEITSSMTFDYAMERAAQPNCIAGYWIYPSGLSKFVERPFQ